MAFNIPSTWKQNPDGTYDVKNSVLVNNTDLVDGKFPIKFGQVSGYFSCGGCPGLTSLWGAPKSVGGYFNCDGCTGLKSLRGIEHTKVTKTFYLPPYLESHILGLFYTGCREVVGEEPWVQVVNQYLLLGQKGIAQCSIALVRAGYKNLAQL